MFDLDVLSFELSFFFIVCIHFSEVGYYASSTYCGGYFTVPVFISFAGAFACNIILFLLKSIVYMNIESATLSNLLFCPRETVPHAVHRTHADTQRAHLLLVSNDVVGIVYHSIESTQESCCRRRRKQDKPDVKILF